MLSDTWGAVRSAIARRWGRDAARTTDVEQRLESARKQALALGGQDGDRQARLEAFWAGYLAGLLGERPDLADALQELTSSENPASGTRNSNTGTVRGSLIQARDVNGNIQF
jgi:hypothetical protein